MAGAKLVALFGAGAIPADNGPKAPVGRFGPIPPRCPLVENRLVIDLFHWRSGCENRVYW